MRRVAALLLVVTACGARSSLLDEPPARGAMTGTGGAGGSEDPPLPRCDLALAGAPAPLLSFPEGDTDAPQMVVLDGGAAGRPARLAYSAISENANFWHPELRVGELSVGAEWPGGASITREPSLFGFDAHGAGLLVHGPGDTVALTFYHGDEANPNVQARFAFRTVDGASWNLGPEVVVDPAGTISYGLAHGENGYLAAWRADIEPTGDVAPRIALLDEGGQIVAGPVDVAAPEPHPGRAADVAWSGTTYLVATAFDDCEGQPEGCQNRSLVVRRLDETGTLTPASAIAAAAGLVPSRPALGAWGNEVWVAWMEAASDDAPRTIRLAQLDVSGALVGAPRTLSTETRPLLRLGVLVSELGVVVAYPEVGDTRLPESEPGHARLVVHHGTSLDDGVAPAIVLPIPSLALGPRVTLAALDQPRGVLVSWAARSLTEEKNVTWLGRFDCQ